MDALQKRKRTLTVGVDFSAAFDKVWPGSLLRELTHYDTTNRLLRWIRAWLADRKAAVLWNNSLSSFCSFQQGVPQGSPLSLFCSCSPPPLSSPTSRQQTLWDVFADDLTTLSQADTHEEAAANVQPVLDCIGKWARSHYIKINMDAGKTEAMVFSLDPRETAEKTRPSLHIDGVPVGHTKHPVTQGITLDPQVTFTEHARLAKKSMSSRNNILRSLSGKNWGLLSADLRHLYKAYVRPAGMYGSGAYYNFLGDSAKKNLEVTNSEAARAITGAPKGSPVQSSRTEEKPTSIR